MKLGLIFISAIFGLFLGTGIALAGSHVATVLAPPPAPVPVEVAPVAIELPTVSITAPRPAAKRVAKAAKPKEWVCGEVYTNLIGGRNRDCEWK